MKKSVLLLFLSFILLFSSSALADNTRTSGLYTYEIKGNGTLIIVDFDWNANNGADVFIPALIDGYTVTSIANNAFDCDVFSKDGECAVRLPEGIVQIGEFAFRNSPINYINIPASVQLIGKGAFANCQNMLQFNVDTDNPVYATIDGVLFNKQLKQLFSYPYASQTKITAYSIPNGIESIAAYSFFWEHSENGRTDIEHQFYRDCYFDLRHISIPGTVKEIGDYAFVHCLLPEMRINMNKIGEGSFYESGTINETKNRFGNISVYAEEIGAYAFYNYLGGINIHVNSIPEYAFYSVSSVTLNTGLEDIGDYALTYSLIETIPSTVKTIGVGAFRGIPSMGNGSPEFAFTIPGSVKHISDEAFYGSWEKRMFNDDDYDWMLKLEIGEGCETIGTRAFSGHTHVSEIKLPSTLTSIGDYAFSSCKRLEKIELPMSLTSIGIEAFSECPMLREITLPESVVDIGNKAFDRANITLWVKKGTYSALWADENGYNYKYIGESKNAEDTSWLNN